MFEIPNKPKSYRSGNGVLPETNWGEFGFDRHENGTENAMKNTKN